MSRPTPCRELTCTGLIAWLKNPQTASVCPVDWDSLTTDEKETYMRREDLYFVPMSHHRMHHKTCTKPGRFTKENKAKGYTE